MSKYGYSRILLKVSGEALAGDQSYGIEQQFLNAVANQVLDLTRMGIQVAIVIGAGNIVRGMTIAAKGGDRVIGDHMGMLGTVINSLALGDAIRRAGDGPTSFRRSRCPRSATPS